jgi:hypothetical protein
MIPKRPISSPRARRAPRCLAATALALLCAACGPAQTGPPPDDTGGGDGVCPAGPQAPARTPAPKLASIGPQSNALRAGDGALWIVESGSNTVSRFDPQTDTLAAGFIDLGNGRNPYDLDVDAAADEVWITNNLGSSITLARASSGEVVEEIVSEEFEDPAGVAALGDYIYVSNFNYLTPDEGFGPGSVTVVDRDSRQVLGSIETGAKNAQYIDVIRHDGADWLAIVDTGPITFGDDGGARAAGDGALELWRPTDDPLDPERRVFALPVPGDAPRVGAPGGPAMQTPDGDALYLSSATAPVLFKFDLGEMRWARGTDDPIYFDDGEGDALHHAAIDDRGIIYVTSFNGDALYLVDTRCDAVLAGPIGLGEAPEVLEGPHGVVPIRSDERVDAYFIMSLKNVIGRVTLDFAAEP